MTESLHCIVRGLVQGVGYRAFVLKHAWELGLTGWARNLPNGDVEVLAQGPDHARRELMKRLRQGPFLARVEAVDAVSEQQETAYENFQIKR